MSKAPPIGLAGRTFRCGRNAWPYASSRRRATTAFGALLAHITGGADAKTFQPMNVNFGLFPEPPAKTRGKDRKRAQSHRAIADLEVWLGTAKAAAE